MIYTMEQGANDRTFKADPGQEITADVYEQMLNGMPPESLPREKARQALQDYNIPIHAGFLMGEPYSTNENGEPLYMAFGMNDFGKGKKYYYLGLSAKTPELHGDYYFFDCMNAFITDRYFKTSAFESEQEAIKTASNYEATLYRYKYNHGERVKTNVYMIRGNVSRSKIKREGRVIYDKSQS